MDGPLHEGPHHIDGPPECFGCRVKSFTVNPYSLPSRLHPSNPPRRPNPAWERGVPTDSRGMPFLTKAGTPMGIKQFTEDRHTIEEHRRQLAQAPQVATT